MPKKFKPTVHLKHPSYQPSRVELEEDVSIDTTFEEMTQAVVKEVRINYVAKAQVTQGQKALVQGHILVMGQLGSRHYCI